ncbi:hypothetical protein [Streptomyces sp. NPDC007355]|uniref:hypothetical protein n=1 Tax=Streptomyces sp. NPDC007355 TaxID=3364778 RepID=UPI0036A846FC
MTGVFIQGCVLGPDGSPRAGERWFTRPELGPDAVVESVLACAASALAEGCRPTAAGVALPGVVDDAAISRAAAISGSGRRRAISWSRSAKHPNLPIQV